MSPNHYYISTATDSHDVTAELMDSDLSEEEFAVLANDGTAFYELMARLQQGEPFKLTHYEASMPVAAAFFRVELHDGTAHFTRVSDLDEAA